MMLSFPPAAPGLSTGRICTMGKWLERPTREDASSRSGRVGFWLIFGSLRWCSEDWMGTRFYQKSYEIHVPSLLPHFWYKPQIFSTRLFPASKVYKREPVSLRFVVQYAVALNRCPGSGFGAPGTGNRANWGH